MADNTQLNQAQAPLGDLVATDDVGGIKHQRVKIEVGVDGVAQDVHEGRPLPIELGMTTPTTSATSVSALAAGGSSDLDSSQINTGLTGKLIALMTASTIPFKGELKTILNGVESSVLMTFFSLAGNNMMLKMPSKDFFTQVESATPGLDGFRITVTNLDTTQAADVYVTYFYDEE